MSTLNIELVTRALFHSWGPGSSSKWKRSNPALGQCGVTALVVQDCLGGEIVKTWIAKPDVEKLWHFYNLLDNTPMDFTVSQFDSTIEYSNLPSSRDEALDDATPEQYQYLSGRVKWFCEMANEASQSP